jgi:hypothetical protein
MLVTVFRELLQNSDDAQSSAVEIRFETAAYLHQKSEQEEGAGPRALPDLKSSFVREPSVVPQIQDLALLTTL